LHGDILVLFYGILIISGQILDKKEEIKKSSSAFLLKKAYFGKTQGLLKYSRE